MDIYMSYDGWKGVCGGGKRVEIEGGRGWGIKVHVHLPPLSAPAPGLLDKISQKKMPFFT
jgi:hypothetical protein